MNYNMLIPSLNSLLPWAANSGSVTLCTFFYIKSKTIYFIVAKQCYCILSILGLRQLLFMFSPCSRFLQMVNLPARLSFIQFNVIVACNWLRHNQSILLFIDWLLSIHATFDWTGFVINEVIFSFERSFVSFWKNPKVASNFILFPSDKNSV